MKLPSGENPFRNIGGALTGLTGLGGTVYGAQTIDKVVKKNHHFKLKRSSERITRLTIGERNPAQFVLDCSRDHVSSFEIKEELVAWNGTWKGTDFSNPDAFDVVSRERESSNPIRSFLGLKDRSCYLKTHPIDKKEDTGTRSVSIESVEVQEATTNDINMEVQEVIGNGINVSTGLYKFNPNLIYEVSAEQLKTVQGETVPDRQFTKVYEFTTSPPLPPIIYYGVSLTVLAGSTLLFRYLQRQYLKWSKSENSQKSASAGSQRPTSTELQGPPPAAEENCTFGERYKSNGNVSSEGTPEDFLEILTSYKRGIISKKATVYVLSKFYDLSVAEALEMLDESQG